MRREGRPLTLEVLRVIVADTPEASACGARLGLAVGRGWGKAVVRNRFRRRVREAFRLNRHRLPPVDLLVMPRRGTADPAWDRIRADFERLAERLGDSGPGRPVTP